MSEKLWQTSRRSFDLSRKSLIMGILNTTPDSFSDGGTYTNTDLALRRVEEMIAEGADILDIGGESTRPKSVQVSAEEEIRRTAPLFAAISKRFDVALSIDTTKSAVAQAAVENGAEIINDVSGLKFDEKIAEVAARHQTGLILMHLRGSFETMHQQTPVEDIFSEIRRSLTRSIETAANYGVKHKQIALDIGIGFSKTLSQNLQLLARLSEVVNDFPAFPILVGASRKSFIGKILGEVSPNERLFGSLGAASIAAFNGADILRVHDVRQTLEAVKVAREISNHLVGKRH